MGKLLTTDLIARKKAIFPNTIEESPRTGAELRIPNGCPRRTQTAKRTGK